MKNKHDKIFLKRAVDLAEEGIRRGCGPFAAVITKNNEVISESSNEVVLSADPTAHAEILAIRKASGLLKTHILKDCTIYSSCEPCPMCLGAIYWAGIRKVIYASDRLEAAKAGFSDNFIYDEIMLDPSERSITFIHHTDADGERVFKKWNDFEEKIQY